MKIALVIPTYNCGNYLPELFNQVKEVISFENIIFINDGSTDNTNEILKSLNCNFISHVNNSGKGRAIQLGIKFAIEKKYDFIITMDADLQHSPSDLNKFIEIVKKNNFDFAIGNRDKSLKNMPFFRYFSNVITSFLVSLRINLKIPDSQCGFRMYRIDKLKNMPSLSNGYEFETEILIWGAKNNFKIISVPIKTIYNNSISSMTHFKTTINFIKTLLKKY